MSSVQGRDRFAVVLPTNRPGSYKKWITGWMGHFGDYDVDVIVMWDLARVPKEAKKGRRVKHLCWSDIKKELGKDAWIIPRKTCDIRSFGMYYAWKQGFDYVISLDDDVVLESNLVGGYKSVFDDGVIASNFFDVGSLLETKNKVFTRGFPFCQRGLVKPLIQYGGWNGVPDFDAVTQLNNPNEKGVVFKNGVRSVPLGVGLTGCSMNVCLHRDAIVLWYQLLMGEGYPFDRAGDIWSGYFLKRAMDVKKIPVVINGSASVCHNRASDSWSNLKKEEPGIKLNETLWNRISSIKVDSSQSFAEIYQDFGYYVSEYNLFDNYSYSNKLGKAMQVWARLFK